MELYLYDIADDTEDNAKRWKKVLQKVIQAQHRQNIFTILSKWVGKGQKCSFKILKVKEHDSLQYRQVSDRNKIEKELIMHNQMHFKQAFTSKVYLDKIYDKLKQNEIRDRVLLRELQESECDCTEVYEFLRLLARDSDYENIMNYDEITENEWIKVVNKAKRKSVSSIFSNRTYSIYKCALDWGYDENITSFLQYNN